MGAESSATSDAELGDLAEKVQNPVANMVSVPLQNNTSFDIGPYRRASNVLNVQPIIPVSFTEDWNLTNRVIMPIGYAPDLNHPTDGASGVGDLQWTGFFSPTKTGEFIWGAGPVLQFPTATQTALGTGHWTVGPSAVALWQSKPWTIGALANNMWSYAGQDGRSAVNQLFVQYFVNYNLAAGWFLTSSPIITANWKASSDSIWTIPFGGGVGKIFKIGSQAMSAQVAAFWNAASPNEGGAAWQSRLQLGFLFPEKQSSSLTAGAF
ncbi:MAG: neuromedin U [Polyangiaceae bacterium]